MANPAPPQRWTPPNAAPGGYPHQQWQQQNGPSSIQQPPIQNGFASGSVPPPTGNFAPQATGQSRPPFPQYQQHPGQSYPPPGGQMPPQQPMNSHPPSQNQFSGTPHVGPPHMGTAQPPQFRPPTEVSAATTYPSRFPTPPMKQAGGDAAGGYSQPPVSGHPPQMNSGGPGHAAVDGSGNSQMGYGAPLSTPGGMPGPPTVTSQPPSTGPGFQHQHAPTNMPPAGPYTNAGYPGQQQQQPVSQPGLPPTSNAVSSSHPSMPAMPGIQPPMPGGYQTSAPPQFGAASSGLPPTAGMSGSSVPPGAIPPMSGPPMSGMQRPHGPGMQPPSMGPGMQQPPGPGMQPPPMGPGMQQPPMGPGMQQPPMGHSMQQPPMGPGMQQPPMGHSMQQPPMGHSMQQPPMGPGMQPSPMGPGMQPPMMNSGMHAPMGPGMPPPMAGYPGHMAPPSQPAKKLDPNMMPSAIQVIEDDRKSRSGSFPTGYPRAELPPLATTEFFSEDQGNCNPSFIRATTYAVPASADMIKQCSIPISMVIAPMAKLHPQERPLPVVNLGSLGPVRCHRCKAYMCPFMEFNDGGRRFRCAFCKANTEVPAEYFAHLDHNGRRIDVYERPELCLGSYEFVATSEYCKNGIAPKAPAFIFMIDVSYNSVKNGVVKLFCDNIRSFLRDLPKDYGDERSQIRVGFATYDQAVHFYNLKSSVGQPVMLIVNDVQEMFVPLVDGFLVTPYEAEAALDCLLQQIPSMFAETRVTEVILGPAIQAGLDALKASDRSGKLFVFHSSLPLFEAPGKLKNRDDRKLLGTDKEKTILTPASEFYSKLGADCVSAGCSVDIFLFPNAYADVATIGCLCGVTGGQLFKYQYFQPEIDGERFLLDLKHDLELPIIFDSIMRLRTSTGIRPTDFFGNFYMSNTTDVELATLDSDKAITVEIKHDDKLDEEGAYFQVAVLFTSAGGQRRLRIHNLSLAVTSDLAAVYRSADLFATINYLSKLGERAVLQKSPRDVREMLTKTCAHILGAYRQHCSPSSSMGQLVLPEGMKLLPLLVNCIIKHDAFVGGSEVTTDDRAWLMQAVPSMRVLDSVYYFYPRAICVTSLDDNEDEQQLAVRCSYENFPGNSAYLLENGVLMFLWIGASTPAEWINDIFGVSNFNQINAETNRIPEKDNVNSRRLRHLIEKMHNNRSRRMKLFIIKQQDKLEPWFKKYLVEDRGAVGSDATPSYVDFLVHIHNEIREMLNR